MNAFITSIKKFVSRKQFKYGGYAIIITLVGIAVVVLLNIGLTALENNFDLKIDMSQNKKYTLNDETKKVIGSLTKDIYIYTTYASGSEDDDAMAIINKMKALSGHIIVENKDPDKEPAFMKPFQQSGTTIQAGSIIISDKESKVFRVLDRNAQYSQSYDYYGNVTSVQNKVEGAVTSAMNYIQLGYMPTVFLVQGHGEATLSDFSNISPYFSDQNYNLQTVNIAQTPDKVKAGDIVMFIAPKQDISDEERDALRPLMDKGGRFVFLFNPLTTDMAKLKNFSSLLKLFDIELKSGLVVEKDPSYMYNINNPTALAPEIESHAITDVLTNYNLRVVLPISGALSLPDVAPDNSITIKPLFKTTDKSYLKALDASSIDQADTDETGPFDVAAAVEKKVGDNVNDNVRLEVVYNSAFLTDYYDKSGNLNMFFSSLDWLKNTEKDVYIRPKSDTNPQISITSAAQFWVIIVVSVLLIPVIMLVAGIAIYLRRKHL